MLKRGLLVGHEQLPQNRIQIEAAILKLDGWLAGWLAGERDCWDALRKAGARLTGIDKAYERVEVRDDPSGPLGAKMLVVSRKRGAIADGAGRFAAAAGGVVSHRGLNRASADC